MPDAHVATSLLDQYAGVKARYPGHLVLFRVGDFYETFGDDAKLLARELDVVLTARGADAQGMRTPMAGVPHHAVETYLGRLVRKGYKVALCDQVEDARLAKGLVRREVTRVVTPGTVVEDQILGGSDHSYLANAVLRPTGAGAYSVVDVSTGEWVHGGSDGPGAEGLVSALAPFQPREILWKADEGGSSGLVSAFRREFPRARLEEAPSPLHEGELPASLRSSADVEELVRESDRRLGAYLRATQPRLLPHLTLVDRGAKGRRLVLDAKTLRHLEINRPMNPDDPGGRTLLDVWDETSTASGRRTLSFWLTNPLADVEPIAARHEAVASLVGRGASLERLRERLHGIADLGRIAARVAGRRVRSDELVTLRSSLDAIASVRDDLSSASGVGRLAELREELVPPVALMEELRSALPDVLTPGADARELFRTGHAPEVDRWRAAEQAALEELAVLERREQEATGIKGLKVGYNQVFGYYLEVTRPHLARVPPHFHRRQTVAQAERYVTEELEVIEHRILEAREAARTAAETRWEEFLSRVDPHVVAIHRVARAVGELDTLATFAFLAQTRGYVRPQVDASTTLVVREGRHPVLERSLGERFVPNDTDLDTASERLLVLTGPNMSGKSTYMRQVGLLVVLAQAGSFVPAKFARIGCVTQLFTRMGFTDEIGRGKSSFMVEMSEVAEILRAADERSLVLLDEVGRGTSTFDGLAIAWATLRYLHDTARARTIVSTHYHQLTDLVRALRAAKNSHFAVQDQSEGIVLLHRLVPGATDRSYGVHVARLAGLPNDVLVEAERLLRELEASGVGIAAPAPRRGRERTPRYTQAVLLGGPAAAADPVLDELRSMDVDRLSADEALARLRDLRRRVGPASEPDR